MRGGISRIEYRSIKRFTAGLAGIAVILLAYYTLTWRSLAGVLAAFDACSDLFCDFVIYYYPEGEAIFRTGLPVEGFLYSPFIAILLAVFPPFGLDASLVLWGILQVVFVILYILLFRQLVPARLPVQFLFAVLALSSYPLLLNFVGGQVSVFMIVALLGMHLLAERGHRAAGAGLFAFAVSFKFYPIIFLAPFAARRDDRMVLFAFVSCVTLLLLIPGLLLGAGDTLGFYGGLLDSFRDSAWVIANPHSAYFPHFVLRLAGTMGHEVWAHLPLLRWFAYGVAAANMGLVFLVERARLPHGGLWSFQIVFLTIPFVLKTSWPHDFVFLSLTQALLAWRLLEGKKTSSVTSFLLLASIALSNIVFFNIFGDFSGFGFYGFLFWADLLLLVALYMELLPPAVRRLRGPQAAT